MTDPLQKLMQEVAERGVPTVEEIKPVEEVKEVVETTPEPEPEQVVNEPEEQDDVEETSDGTEATTEATTEKVETKPVNKALERISARKRAEAAELEAARLKGQIEILTQKPTETKPEPVNTDPEPEKDSYEHDAWVAREAIRKAEEAKKELDVLKAQLEFSKAETAWKDLDSRLSDSDPVYKSSMDFLRNKAREELSNIYPEAPKSVIENQLKQLEYIHAAKAEGFASHARNADEYEKAIRAYFLGQAISDGYNPYSDVAPKLVPQTKKPQTDKAEVNFHKRNAGSVAVAPAGEGYKGVTLRDTGRMSLQELTSTMGDKSKFNALLEEASRKDARGEFAFQ